MTLLVALGTVPAWHRDAACGPLGRLFMSKLPEDIAKQKEVCASCPARAKCAKDYARKQKDQLPDLVTAGLTREEILNGGLVDAPRECTSCHDVKPLDQFGRKQRAKSGRSSVCLKCTSANARAAYAARKKVAS